MARSMIVKLSVSLVCGPKFIVPRHSGLTSKPERPRWRYSMPRTLDPGRSARPRDGTNPQVVDELVAPVSISETPAYGRTLATVRYRHDDAIRHSVRRDHDGRRRRRRAGAGARVILSRSDGGVRQPRPPTAGPALRWSSTMARPRGRHSPSSVSTSAIS